MNTFSGYLAFWFVLMLLAIANGTLRQYTYGKFVSELHAHQLSTLTGMLLFGCAVWLFATAWRSPDAPRQAVAIGIVWLFLTLAFECLFGRFVVGHSWQRLLRDYDLLAGRVWVVFLLWLTMLPYAIYRVTRHSS